MTTTTVRNSERGRRGAEGTATSTPWSSLLKTLQEKTATGTAPSFHDSVFIMSSAEAREEEQIRKGREVRRRLHRSDS